MFVVALVTSQSQVIEDQETVVLLAKHLFRGIGRFKAVATFCQSYRVRINTTHLAVI